MTPVLMQLSPWPLLQCGSAHHGTRRSLQTGAQSVFDGLKLGTCLASAAAARKHWRSRETLRKVSVSSVLSRPASATSQPDESEKAWLRHRLERELVHMSVDPSVLTPGHHLYDLVEAARPAIDTFLNPASIDALAVARVPGRARSVAASLAAVLQQARAQACDQLCNVDRTSTELLEHPLGPHVPLVVALDIREPPEVGCLLRTCEAMRVRSVFLCGETPAPEDPQVLKTSMSSQAHLSIEQRRCLGEAAEELRNKGNSIWCLAGGTCRENRKRATNKAVYYLDDNNCDFELPRPMALLFSGCHKPDDELLDICEGQLRFATGAEATSLTDSIAGSIAIHEIVRHWNL